MSFKHQDSELLFLGGDLHKKKKKHSDDYYYRGDLYTHTHTYIYCMFIFMHFQSLVLFSFFSFCQTMVWAHLPTRKNTNLLSIPLPSPPHRLCTRQTQQWVFCRPSRPRWPQALTPVLICTRNRPTPLSPRTRQRTRNAMALVEAKAATPSLTPALCLHRHPLRSIPLPPSRLCSMAGCLKRSR